MRGTSTRVLIPKSRARLTNSGQRVSDWRGETTSGCWFSHTQPAGSWSTGSRRLVIDGIAGLIQNMPLHGVAVGIVQNQPDMIEADNSAKRFGYAREQTSQVRAAGDRTRERDHSLIKCVLAGAVLAADQDGGIRRCDGLDLFHHAPHGCAAAGDIVRMEFAPDLGFRSTFSISRPLSRTRTVRLLPIRASILNVRVALLQPGTPAGSPVMQQRHRLPTIGTHSASRKNVRHGRRCAVRHPDAVTAGEPGRSRSDWTKAGPAGARLHASTGGRHI